jgi:hypothetical protein
MEREGTQAQKDKQVFSYLTLAFACLACTAPTVLSSSRIIFMQELMLTRRQNAKSQARKDARAFKELDTTLQVLGINGKQAAVEPTGNDLQTSRKIQRAVSEASR